MVITQLDNRVIVRLGIREAFELFSCQHNYPNYDVIKKSDYALSVASLIVCINFLCSSVFLSPPFIQLESIDFSKLSEKAYILAYDFAQCIFPRVWEA